MGYSSLTTKVSTSRYLIIIKYRETRLFIKVEGDKQRYSCRWKKFHRRKGKPWSINSLPLTRGGGNNLTSEIVTREQQIIPIG